MQTVATRAYALDKGRVIAAVKHEELMDTKRVADFLAI